MTIIFSFLMTLIMWAFADRQFSAFREQISWKQKGKYVQSYKPSRFYDFKK